MRLFTCEFLSFSPSQLWQSTIRYVMQVSPSCCGRMQSATIKGPLHFRNITSQEHESLALTGTQITTAQRALASPGVIGPIPSALSSAVALKARDGCATSSCKRTLYYVQDIKNTSINSLKALSHRRTATFPPACHHANILLTSVSLQSNFSNESIFVSE